MNSKDDVTKGWQVEVRCFKGFIERFFKSHICTHNFTSWFHFRSKETIYLSQFCEWKDWCFDMDMVTFWIKTIFVTLLSQWFTKNQVCSNLSHWDISHLRQEWYCTAGTWVNLDNIDCFVLNNELDVHHTDTVKTDSQTFRVISDSLLDFLRKSLWWVNRHWVPWVNPRTFDVFHNTWN